MNNKKRFLLVSFLVLAAMVPVFAAEAGWEDLQLSGTLDLSFIAAAIKLIVGVFGGGFCLIKFALDLFEAIKDAGQNSQGIKRAIVQLLVHAAILITFFFIIGFVFNRMGDTPADKNGFFAGITLGGNIRAAGTGTGQ